MIKQKSKQRKKKKRATLEEPYLITRAVTHIRLVEVNSGKLAALDALAPVYLALCQGTSRSFVLQSPPTNCLILSFARPFLSAGIG